jgi:hypothetical protein
MRHEAAANETQTRDRLTAAIAELAALEAKHQKGRKRDRVIYYRARCAARDLKFILERKVHGHQNQETSTAQNLQRQAAAEGGQAQHQR